MFKIFIISSLDKSLGRIFSNFRNSNFKPHLLSLIEQIWELIWKFHLKSIVRHIKINSLTALWIKWGQKEEKILPGSFSAHLSSIESFWGAHFKISYSISVAIYQNWSFSWIINKKGSEVEKIVAAHFWLEWVVLRSHFRISFMTWVVIYENRSF